MNMKKYEEWKEKAREEKTEISKTDLIKVCSRIANAAAKPEDETVGIIGASMETLKIIAEFFPEKEEKKEKKEPDAKPVESRMAEGEL